MDDDDYPLLTKYVTDRDTFFDELSDTYNLDKSLVKLNCLKVINMTTWELQHFLLSTIPKGLDTYLKRSVLEGTDTFTALNKEICDIRDYIYERHYEPHSPIFSYLEDNREFQEKRIEKKLVTVQSLYLQTRETVYVHALITYLKEQYAKSDGLTLDPSCTEFDKEVSISEHYHFLRCIPFFDGCFIGSENRSYLINEIPGQVERFNKDIRDKGSLIEFVQKDTHHPYKHIDGSSLDNYIEVRNIVNSLDVANFSELLKLLNLPNNTYDDFVDNELGSMKVRTAQFRKDIYNGVEKVLEDRKKECAEEVPFLTYLRKKRYSEDGENHSPL